jgi:CRP/FNR family transcriptional regulator
VETKGFVFTEGDTATYIYRVETGAVALYKVIADGRRQILGFAYPGDILGLGAIGEHSMNAQAIKPTRLRRLPVATLRQSATRNPRIGLKLYEALAKELTASRDLVLTTSKRSAMERVVGFLLAFYRHHAQDTQGSGCFELPMTRSDIGDFLGMGVETVSRTFTRLRIRRLIELPRADHVKLVDIAELKGIADGQSGVLGDKHRSPCRLPSRMARLG